MGLRVWGLGLRVEVLGFGVQGLSLGVIRDFGLTVLKLQRFMAQDCNIVGRGPKALSTPRSRV